MVFPENLIEKYGVTCKVWNVSAPVYDPDYNEFDPSSSVWTNAGEGKIYLVREAGNNVSRNEEGWHNKVFLDGYYKSSGSFTLGEGTEMTVVEVTEGINAGQYRVVFMKQFPFGNTYKLLLEPLIGGNIAS